MTKRLRELEAAHEAQRPMHDAVVRVPNQLLAQKAVSELVGYRRLSTMSINARTRTV